MSSSGSDGGDPPRVAKAKGLTPAQMVAQSGDPRAVRVWREWLGAMASNAEAALAAAIAYRDLEPEGRERWLASLEADAPNVEVPRVALYAPLLAVEDDPARRQRLMRAMEEGEEGAPARARHHALSGTDRAGARVAVVVIPLYLDFVQVLACAFSEERFLWVRHDPIVERCRAPQPGESVQGVRLEATPLKSALDALASAVLAHRRTGERLPEALGVLAELLGPGPEPATP